ncbi:DUF3545 family protein [Colwellia psychrerythraea]|uniref:DUF3545 domain-containing protein n=1 Tax=Colwellia psychrerythraea TaxID=28229 RepID=A0A099L1U6_COLPS|nr:DUF3545 family protein [Colwellia psychrerythraea]KGJ96939.1 Protein of unknown function DUF3545 [Colwellia psychrerythraea]
MKDNYWQESEILDDVDEQETADRSSRSKGKVRKRKWREIEAIKEQRRLRRSLADFEQYSY